MVVVIGALKVNPARVRLIPPEVLVFSAPPKLVVPVPVDCKIAPAVTASVETFIAEPMVKVPIRVVPPIAPVREMLPVPAVRERLLAPSIVLRKTISPPLELSDVVPVIATGLMKRISLSAVAMLVAQETGPEPS